MEQKVVSSEADSGRAGGTALEHLGVLLEELEKVEERRNLLLCNKAPDKRSRKEQNGTYSVRSEETPCLR